MSVSPEPLKEIESELARISLRIERRKLALQKLETKLELSRSGWGHLFSPTGAAILAGLLGLLGTVYNGFSANQLEEKKLESSIIIKAAEIKDAQERASTLLFFQKSGHLNLNQSTRRSLMLEAGLNEEDSVPSPTFWGNNRLAGIIETLRDAGVRIDSQNLSKDFTGWLSADDGTKTPVAIEQAQFGADSLSLSISFAGKKFDIYVKEPRAIRVNNAIQREASLVFEFKGTLKDQSRWAFDFRPLNLEGKIYRLNTRFDP